MELKQLEKIEFEKWFNKEFSDYNGVIIEIKKSSILNERLEDFVCCLKCSNEDTKQYFVNLFKKWLLEITIIIS